MNEVGVLVQLEIHKTVKLMFSGDAECRCRHALEHQVEAEPGHDSSNGNEFTGDDAYGLGGII